MESSGFAQYGYSQGVCPSCGRCPTCGRGGYYQYPYPQITYTKADSNNLMSWYKTLKETNEPLSNSQTSAGSSQG